MELHAKSPDPLSGTGNMLENWSKWKEDFDIFMKIANCDTKSQEYKACLLRNQIGKFGRDVIEKIDFSHPNQKNNYNILLAKLDEHFDVPKNEVIERYNFFKRSMKENETLENYIKDLKEKAVTCNFKKMEQSLIRDRIILEIKDKKLREKLFETENLDLKKMVSIFNEHKREVVKVKSKEHNADKKHVDTTADNSDNVNITNRFDMPMNHQKARNNENNRACWRCRESHTFRNCPAWTFRCKNCGALHHYTHCCPNYSVKSEEKNANISKTQTSMNNDVSHDYMKKTRENPMNLMEAEYHHPYHHTYRAFNTQPSAPTLPLVENTLYPNLNGSQTTDYGLSSKSSSNIKLGTIAEDHFQKTVPPNDQRARNNDTYTGNNVNQSKETKKKDGCVCM